MESVLYGVRYSSLYSTFFTGNVMAREGVLMSLKPLIATILGGCVYLEASEIEDYRYYYKIGKNILF